MLPRFDASLLSLSPMLRLIKKDDDDGLRSKPQPKAKAGAKKAGCLMKGPAAKKKTSPKGS